MSTPRKQRLQIEGTTGDAYAADATHGPWAVFDPDAQDNVAGPFVHRWQASFARWWLEIFGGEGMT